MRGVADFVVAAAKDYAKVYSYFVCNATAEGRLCHTSIAGSRGRRRGRLRSRGSFGTRLEAGSLHFGVATLCLISQPWVILGDLGWKWVNIGGQGRGGRKNRVIL